MSRRVLNLDLLTERCWPDCLRPLGGHACEPVAEWFSRNSSSLAHLPEDLCEQWIYRQCAHIYSFLPLADLSWSRHIWSGEKLLASVHIGQGEEFDPEFDYATFQRRGGDDRHPTAVALDNGTWDYPMVLLTTPDGVIECGEFLEHVRYVVVEGRQRHRYLNALHRTGRPPEGPHEVIILRIPAAGGNQ